MKKLLVVDGNSILNRAFFGIHALTTKDGTPTNAIYGMVTMLQRQIDAVKPDACAVAYDVKEPTFRHKMYREYKAGRHPMPEELFAQLPVSKACCRLMGLTVIECPGYEADDILGTLAARGESAGAEVYLMTGDRDSLQLITDQVKVLLATNKETVTYDRDLFRQTYGVEASEFVDVKALMGDSSDNIPGVAGIGEKTALKLIADYHSLEGIYAALPDANLPPKMKQKLEVGRESAIFSRALAKICKEAPLTVTDEELAYHGIDRDGLRAMFVKLEFTKLLARFGLDTPDVTAPQSTRAPSPTPAEGLPTAQEQEAKAPRPLPDAVEETAQTWAKRMEENPAHACAVMPLGDALVTFDGNALTKISLADPQLALALSSHAASLILHDAKSFYHLCHQNRIRLSTCGMDVMLAAYILSSDRKTYALADLAVAYLGRPARTGEGAAADIYALQAPLTQALAESGQTDLLRKLEEPLSHVLYEMEERGFRIDTKGLAACGEELDALLKTLEGRIFTRAGKEFNLLSPKQLSQVLYNDLGLSTGKKTHSGFVSTNVDALMKLRHEDPIVDDLLEYRQISKLRLSYVDGFLKVVGSDGRVHTSFKQTGAATGRLSSTEPNLQTIPIHTERGKQLRRYFLPESTDYLLVDADYSQIELRLLAHISGDTKMIAAFNSGADIHTATAATVFNIPQSMVTSEMRKQAKVVNFGILYGMGAHSLAEDLGISQKEAQIYITNYKANYPGVSEYLSAVIEQGYRAGYVTTLFGRRRYIAELKSGNAITRKAGERIAMNSPIQGTAADLIKVAMIRVADRLKKENLDATLILQVHDELILEAHRSCAERAAQVLKEEMEAALTLSVPLLVEVSIGETLYACKN